jgi:pilus assembly protein Flp/PilA
MIHPKMIHPNRIHPKRNPLSLPVCLAGFLHRAERRKQAIAPVIRHLLRDESAQDLIEYALVAALVGLGAVTALKSLKNTVGNTFNSVGSSLTNSV